MVASACGGVTRATETYAAQRGPVGGGGGRRSCTAAACSRHVGAPMKGLPRGSGVGGEGWGVWLRGLAAVLEGS